MGIPKNGFAKLQSSKKKKKNDGHFGKKDLQQILLGLGYVENYSKVRKNHNKFHCVKKLYYVG